jgi:hypothetical protein
MEDLETGGRKRENLSSTAPLFVNHIKVDMMFSDTETDMLGGCPPSASCVQGSDDSRNSAIRIAYRTLLRSSSLWEPRYPSLKIFLVYILLVLII